MTRWHTTLLALCLPLICVSASSAPKGLVIEGKKYLYAYEIKCRVKKAVPAPEKGPTWYTSSSIGSVWMKFTPTSSVSKNGQDTFGTIVMYRTDRVYKELVTYDHAWWTWSDEEEIQGTAKFSPQASLTGPYSFSVSRFEEQGFFHGSDGDPKYFLTDCIILDALATYTAAGD